MSLSPKPTLENWIDKYTFCELLGIDRRTADRWVRERVGPPRYKARKKVLYKKSELEAWLESQQVGK